MLKYIFKTIYSYSFILMVTFFAGCGGENSNSFGISSLKNSFLNLIDSHSNNLTAIPSGGLYVFVTSYTNSTSVLPLTHNGNFTGISGADAYCNSHIPSSLSGTGSYKAMLVDGVNRVATTVGPNSSSGQKDWVFIKNTSYYRPDGKMVFTTNDAGLFDFSTGSLSYAFVDSFTSGILEFGLDFSPIGKRFHLHNFVLLDRSLGQTEMRLFKEGLDMQITKQGLLFQWGLFLVNGKKPKTQILKEVWRWGFFVYKKNLLH